MSAALGRKCDDITAGIDSALTENARAMAGIGQVDALSPHYEQLASDIRGLLLPEWEPLSMPDPPGTTRLAIIRRELGS